MLAALAVSAAGFGARGVGLFGRDADGLGFRRCRIGGRDPSLDVALGLAQWASTTTCSPSRVMKPRMSSAVGLAVLGELVADAAVGHAARIIAHGFDADDLGSEVPPRSGLDLALDPFGETRPPDPRSHDRRRRERDSGFLPTEMRRTGRHRAAIALAERRSGMDTASTPLRSGAAGLGQLDVDCRPFLVGMAGFLACCVRRLVGFGIGGLRVVSRFRCGIGGVFRVRAVPGCLSFGALGLGVALLGVVALPGFLVALGLRLRFRRQGVLGGQSVAFDAALVASMTTVSNASVARARRDRSAACAIVPKRTSTPATAHTAASPGRFPKLCSLLILYPLKAGRSGRAWPRRKGRAVVVAATVHRDDFMGQFHLADEDCTSRQMWLQVATVPTFHIGGARTNCGSEEAS